MDPVEKLTYVKDEVIFEEGFYADSLYLVKKGRVGIFVSDGKEEKQLSDIPAGALFGEMSLFDGLTRSATARALEDCEVIRLDYKKLNHELSEMPDWVKLLLTSMTKKIRAANNSWLENNNG